ncbi:S8 family serine peptidase [Shewanella profunda]|uniref:S8 family serine peptidase n=1 Tax=Shewanella profunda TaxID=254793 RepID=UPI00200C4F61|nr:S8 family serine peptidase [Shewanella profunda]MCL1090917.1 S8 family serine peptidase [Shewanella profunda]
MRMSIVALSITAALLAGCGSDKKSPEPVNTAPLTADITIDVSQSLLFSGKLDATDAEGGLTYSLVDPSDIKLGTLTLVNKSTGEFTYSTDVTEGTEVIKFKVSDGQYTAEANLIINIKNGDPLYAYQWHLKNTGQNAFAASRGVVGEDMNVSGAMSQQIMGQGITVAVVDDGLEIAHADLVNNIVNGGSYNLITGTVDPTPFAGSAGHGTAVGGIIAAEGWNGIGGRGVAPKAQLIGFNFLDSDPTGQVANVQTFENFVKSHGASAYSDSARVFNQSYGYSVPFPDTFDEDETEVYRDVATQSFDGKGSIFVKSAGNGYDYYRFRTFWLPGDYFDATPENPANHGLPFHNSNMSSDNANVYNLVVSAINANGQLSSYSSVGSNVFLTAPGGEYGDDAPAIVTTDRMGCDKGSVIAEDRPSTPFHGGLHPLNSNCDYTSTMNGTSSAAPNTSGAVAVIMSANPELTWRDVRHVLAKTATKVDAQIAAKTVTVGVGEGAAEYAAIPAWQQNAAGFSFHNLYGFGRVNVSEAVKLAKSYAEDLGEYVVSEWQASEVLAKSIPDANVNGVSDTQVVTEDLVIEAVQIELTADHLRLPDLAVELISPAGTKSVLMTPYNGQVYQGVMDKTNPNDIVTGYDATPMLSNAFYGESSKGEWTIKLIDVNSGSYRFIKYDQGYISIPNEADGKLKGWSIRFHGHAAKSAS